VGQPQAGLIAARASAPVDDAASSGGNLLNAGQQIGVA